MSSAEKVSVFDKDKNQINPATKEQLGEEGSNPPPIQGSGVIGYLRAIYENFIAGIVIAFSQESLEDVNTKTSTSGAGWTGNVWRGAGEKIKKEYVYTSTVVEGSDFVLSYEFSPNGVDYSAFPVEGFDGESGIHEYHSAHKGLRWFRPVISCSNAPTAFRHYTYYTNVRVRLNAPIRQSLATDADAEVVRSVSAGEVRNPDGVPSGFVDNVQITPERAQIVDMPPTTVFRVTSQDNGILKSGPMPVFDKAGPIIADNVIDFGFVDLRRFSNAWSHFSFNLSGIKIFLMNASDQLGNNGSTLDFSQPTGVTVAGRPFNIGAPYFQSWFRLVIVNDTGTDCDGYAAIVEGLNGRVSPVIVSGDQTVLTYFPMPVNQSLLRIQDDSGSPLTHMVQGHVNSRGNVSLAVINSARLSEAFDNQHKSAHRQVTGLLTPVTEQLFSIPEDKIFWLFGGGISATNTLTTGGLITLSDAAEVRVSIPIAPGTNQTKQVTALPLSLPEPIPFTGQVSFTIPATGIGATASAFVTGYLESAPT